jgi:putative flippase GtrA
MKPDDAATGWRRLLSFARSLVAGAAATIADLSVLALAVGVLGLSARVANVPALLVGALVQFIGNRRFAFARAAEGSMTRQLAGFALVEIVALGLNGVVYDAIAQRVTLQTVSAVLVRCAVSFVVYVAWSYPLFCRVFRVGRAADRSVDHIPSSVRA